MYLPEKGYKRVMVVTFYVALGCVIAFFFFKYLFIALLPFLIGLLIAHLIQPAINFLHEKARFPKKLTVLLIVLFAFAVVGFLLFLLFSRIAVEFEGLREYLPTLPEKISGYADQFAAWLDTITIDLPWLNFGEIIGKLTADLDQTLLDFAQFASPYLATFVKNLAVGVPYTLLFIVITIIAVCYISMDYRRIIAFIRAQIPEKAYQYVTEVKDQFVSTTLKYFKAYSFIIFITFIELLIGFSIIGVPYALVLAVVVALIDILPVLGTGTVLIPWAVFSLIGKDFYTGIAILVLYGLITLIRQIIEPRIVGTTIGLYPLVTLLCMYLGVRIAGLGGLFGFPIAAIILKNMNDKGMLHLYKNPPKSAEEALIESKAKYKRFQKKK